MTTLTSLPAEVLTRIFLELPIIDCVNLAKAGRFLNEVSKIDLLWEKKIFRDFEINIKKVNCSGPSPRTFYSQILYKYGKLLGLWQVTSYGHRGGLFQCVFDNWKLKLLEWFPPRNHPKSPMMSKDFLSMHLFEPDQSDTEGQECDIHLHYSDWSSFNSQCESDEDQFKINFETDQTCSISFPSAYQKTLDPNVLLMQGQWMNVLSNIDWNDQEACKFYCKMNFLRNSQIGNKGIELRRLSIENLFKEFEDSKQKPISPGIFKGNYGPYFNSHWPLEMEMIKLDYPNDNTLQGMKLTGDLNVPMNKLTFEADLTKGVVLSEEEQRELECHDLKEKSYPFHLNYLNGNTIQGKENSKSPIKKDKNAQGHLKCNADARETVYREALYERLI